MRTTQKETNNRLREAIRYNESPKYMKHDPRDILNNNPMRPLQICAVVICIFMSALDGFDVLAITFAAPGIARDWSLEPNYIGIIIAVGFFGMTVGSIFLAPLADRYGRRLVILSCLPVMGGGMLLSAFSIDVIMLSASRFITGLGVGIMIAATNAMTAEYSNNKRRDLCLSVMSVGYPIGGVLGGSVAVVLLESFHWSSVFIFGGIVTLAAFPLVLFLLPESIEYLSVRKGSLALKEVNTILRRMGHVEADHILVSESPSGSARIKDLFTPNNVKNTVVLTSCYLLHLTTFYYILGWIPSIVTALGFDMSVGTSVSIWVSIGGIIGGTLLGFTAAYFGLVRLIVLMMLGGGSFIIVFGYITPQIESLKIVAFMLGFCMYSGVIGLFVLIIRAFPTELRATSTGFIIGVGRLGAVIGPLATGFLLAADIDRSFIAIIMAMGSIAAAIILLSNYIIGKSQRDLL